MNITFATRDTIKQPTGGLILQDIAPEDWILGSKDPKKLGFQVLVENSHWAPYLPIQEIQRVRDGDTYGCVGFSKNNATEMVHKRKYGYEINLSDRLLVVGSGTVRGVGNSMRGVSEWMRLNGFVLEADYPYNRQMTLDEFYATVPADIRTKAKEGLKINTTNYMALAGSGQETLIDGLRFSPVQVAIEGRYTFDSNGRIRYTGGDYTHAVIIFDYVPGANGSAAEWWVFDSETEQFLRFRGDYAFVSPLIHFLDKKTMKLYKKIGQSAICLKHWSEPSLIAFGDGVIPGGDLFKSIYSVEKYSDLPREDVTEWPYPIKYVINTSTFNLSSIE